jgi:hypothetical protein
MAVLLALTDAARAERESVAWSAPSNCPDRAALMTAVERLLERPLSRDDRLVAVATVSESERG